MNKLKVSAIALAAAVGLAACGGGSSNNGGGSTVESRTFESSFINGVSYSTPTQSGTTGVDCLAPVVPGCFNVIPGEEVTFTIGNLVLPPVVAAAGQTRITVVDIAKAIDEDAGILSIPARAVVAYLDALDTGDVGPVDGKRVFNVKAPANPEAATVELNDLVDGIAEDDLAALQTKLEEALNDAGEEVVVDVDAAEDTDLAKDELGFKNGLEPSGVDFDQNGQELIISDLLGLWTLSEEEGISGVFFGNDGASQFVTTLAGSEFGPEKNLNDIWNVKSNVLIVAADEDDGTTECILTNKASASQLSFRCIEAGDDEFFNITLNKVNDLAAVLTAGTGAWNTVFEERFNEAGTVTFGPNNSFTDSITDLDEGGTTDTASGTFSVNGITLTLNVTMEGGETVNETVVCHFAGLKQNAQSQVEDIFLRCDGDDEEPDEDTLLTKRAGVEPLSNTAEESNDETVALL